MAFDPNAFMQSAVEPMATTFDLPPEGDCKFMIDADPKQLTPKEIKWDDDKGSHTAYQLELTCIALDDKVKSAVGRDKVTIPLPVGLDLDVNGRLEVGRNKNVALGALREALNQNTPGWTPDKLLGAGPFMGKIWHRPNKKDPAGRKFPQVTRPTRIS